MLLQSGIERLHRIIRTMNNQGVVRTSVLYYRRIVACLYGGILLGRKDVYILPDARLSGLKYMEIGANFGAGKGLWLETVIYYQATGQKFSPRLIIGDRVNIGEYVHIGCNHHIKIGDDVLMGSKIYITDHNHGIYRDEIQDSPEVPPIKRRLTEGESVVIGDRCWIGEFVTILPGVTIGEGCIIGSHSTVTHDIPANSIAVGSPARVVKKWDEVSKKWIRV